MSQHEDFYPENFCPAKFSSPSWLPKDWSLPRFPSRSILFVHLIDLHRDIHIHDHTYLHTYIPIYLRTFIHTYTSDISKRSWANCSICNISQHPTIQPFRKVRTLCEHRCKKVIVMCRKRPSVLKGKVVADS